MKSTVSPSRYFGMKRQGFSTARLTWPAYIYYGRKRENSCLKRSYYCIHMYTVDVPCSLVVTWLWTAKCVSVMTKMLPLYNFNIPCHGRWAWKTSREARASARSRFWVVESILFGVHVFLRLHWFFSLKSDLFPRRDTYVVFCLY